MILITQYFDSNNKYKFSNVDKQRKIEFMQCIHENIKTSFFNRIILLNEKIYNLDIPFVEEYLIGKRLTFQDAFDWANTYARDEICVLSNIDIHFDYTLCYLDYIDFDKSVVVLTRSENTKLIIEDNTNLVNYREQGINIKNSNDYQQYILNPDIYNWERTNSQDTWIFKAPINIKNADIMLGTSGCDQAILSILLSLKGTLSRLIVIIFKTLVDFLNL